MGFFGGRVRGQNFLKAFPVNDLGRFWAGDYCVRYCVSEVRDCVNRWGGRADEWVKRRRGIAVLGRCFEKWIKLNNRGVLASKKRTQKFVFYR
jgi:hypothetical protein